MEQCHGRVGLRCTKECDHEQSVTQYAEKRDGHHILQRGGSTEDEVLEGAEEGLGSLRFSLPLV